MAFHFTLHCVDPYASQNATSGPTPVKGELTGNRRGARASAEAWYEGPSEFGTGTQVNYWTLRGKFTSPTDFKGRVEYEAASSPPPPFPRPQCVDAARIHLIREP